MDEENGVITEKIELDELMKQMYRKIVDLENEVEKLKEREKLFATAYDTANQKLEALIVKLKRHAVLADILRDL